MSDAFLEKREKGTSVLDEYCCQLVSRGHFDRVAAHGWRFFDGLSRQWAAIVSVAPPRANRDPSPAAIPSAGCNAASGSAFAGVTRRKTAQRSTLKVKPMTPTFWLIAGASGGALFVLIAHALRRHMRQTLFCGLVVAALAYVIFSIHGRTSASWVALELLGVAVYGSLAFFGRRGSQWWLVAGWALHPIWDLALHYFGPGSAFAPAPYALACLSWDPIVAGYIAYRILRTPKEMSPTVSTMIRASGPTIRGGRPDDGRGARSICGRSR
jgi:hypothetical protein